MARIIKCPDCDEWAVAVVIRRDSLGDVVAFMKCLRCGYEDRKTVAGSIDLYDEDEDDDEY